MIASSGVAYARLSSALFFFLSIVLILTSDKGFSKLFVGLCVTLVIALLFNQAFIARKIRHESSLVQADVFFMMAYFGVLVWSWAADIFGIHEIGRLPNSNYANYVNNALALITLGISAFALGFNLWNSVKSSELYNTSNRDWRAIGFLLFYLGFTLILLYAMYYGREAFTGRYTGSEVGNLAVRTTYLLQGIFVKLGIVLIYLTEHDRSRWIPRSKVPSVIVLGILLMYLILGDRSEFANTAIVVLFAYSYSFKRITLPIIIAGIVGFIFLSSAVRVARIQDHRSIEKIWEAITSGGEKVSVESGLENVSSSGLLTLTALATVPEKFDYFHGRLKLNELLGIIPFGRKIITIKHDNKNEVSTSSWLTWYVLGPNSATGVGTNIVVDLYLDFGFVGVSVGMLMIGLIVGYVQKKINIEGSWSTLIAYCYFAGTLTIMPRYAILTFIRGLIWPLVFIWIIKKFIKKRPVN